jgi:hypothetical protein
MRIIARWTLRDFVDSLASYKDRDHDRIDVKEVE